ncbi:MAG: hypothetical protein HYR72_14595 [Deltaproteobacteria bacterium]|nr:hypothetical protein [Deltaproteobacteria bacterium]MBI3389994.1 hypothetical protein [Deltaproteobacteria bacterium]
MKLSPDLLHQHWVHSHEEDTDTEKVFRPATFQFPRARGRASFELKPDGTLRENVPGPTDRREERSGTWKLEGDNMLAMHGLQPSWPARRLAIVSVTKDRLVVRK